MTKRDGFLLFYDLESTAKYLTNEELGEVMRLVLRKFPEGELPSTPGGKVLYSVFKSQQERSDEYITKKVEANIANGSKSIGAPRKGETQEEYQGRKVVFYDVLNYCKENGYIQQLKGTGPINGLLEEIRNKFNITETEAQKILGWIRKNYKG